MPPNGVDDITPKTVVKKLKDEAFAAGANWEQVGRMRDAAEILGIRRGTC
jgi:predicted hydrolase (HD superfamily)